MDRSWMEGSVWLRSRLTDPNICTLRDDGQVEVEGAGRAATSFTPQEEELFVSMARSPDIYQVRGA